MTDTAITDFIFGTVTEVPVVEVPVVEVPVSGILEIYPYEIALGDKIATHFNPVGYPTKFGDSVTNIKINPRGCKGSTHTNNNACYANIAKVFVLRKH